MSWRLLRMSQNLQKFDATPVHTLRELVDFHDVRLCDEARFLGVFTPEGEMVAGACLFWFSQARVLHTQYLATAPLKGCVPSTYLYDSVVRAGAEPGSQMRLLRHQHARPGPCAQYRPDSKQGRAMEPSIRSTASIPKVYREE